MEKFHNEYYRQLCEIKQALASAVTAENAIILARQLQRDCLNASPKEKAKSWDRFFRLLEILGLTAVSPDLQSANEAAVWQASPPPILEKLMHPPPPAAAVETPHPPCPRT